MDGAYESLPHFQLELRLIAQGVLRVAGVDEVGRGPLCGPVTAAAVRLRPDCIPPGLNDSKKLTREKREDLALRIIDCAEVAIAHATVEESTEALELGVLLITIPSRGSQVFAAELGTQSTTSPIDIP